MKATQQLKDEHEIFRLMLKIMERMITSQQKNSEMDREHFAKVIDFIKGFADKCHHGKEEEILFPAMEKHGIPKEVGPIAVMLNEHELGRNHVRTMTNAFDEFRNGNSDAAITMILSAKNYIDLLRNHIEKENNILFVMADRVIGEKEQNEIYEAFEKLEEKKFGTGKHAEYHKLPEELSSIYL